MLRILTEKQKDAYIVLTDNPDGSLRKWAKELGISHTSLEHRLYYVERKGYITKENGKFSFTSGGLEKIMNDQIHTRFIRTKK